MPLPPTSTQRTLDEPSPARAPAQPWRVLVTPAMDGPENMGLDQALMGRAGETGEVVLRVYGWSRPTLSLGRNQTARGKYDLARARSGGVDMVRRPTGGRAVLHHREITYSVTAPVGALGSLRESYRLINRLLVEGLNELGVAASEATPTMAAPKPDVAPCFVVPVKGEIVAGGRKLVGSAQVREYGVLLQHGSILVDDDQLLASSLLLDPTPAPPAPATLRALLGRAPTLDEVADAVSAVLPDTRPLAVDPALAAAARAASGRYRDPQWTWRR